MAFQLVGEGEKKRQQNEKELSLVGHLSTFRSIVFVWLGSHRMLLAHGMGLATGNAGEYSRGICIILHIQSGSALSAAA